MTDGAKPSLGIIGAGKVGVTLARLYHQRGYRVAAVYSRTAASAQGLADQVGAVVVKRPDAVISSADLTLVTVPDDALDGVARALTDGDVSGKGIVHTSGARDAAVFGDLMARGAMVGSLHPAFPFAQVETAMRHLPGAAFAVEAGDARLMAWLRDLVAALDGQALVIPSGGKTLYHAALVFASNYTVTLYALAETLLVGLGADRPTADAALNPLVAGMVENVRLHGIPAALTGPLARADWGTVAAHAEALERVDGDVAALYVRLAQASLPMLAARGIETDLIGTILQQALTRLQE